MIIITECKYHKVSSPASSCPGLALVRSAGGIEGVKRTEELYCLNGDCGVAVVMDHRNFLKERLHQPQKSRTFFYNQK